MATKDTKEKSAKTTAKAAKAETTKKEAAPKAATTAKSAAAPKKAGAKAAGRVKGAIKKPKAKAPVQEGETDIIRRATHKLVAKNKKVAEFTSGDTVGVYVKVREGDKERVQLYKGVVIKVQGEGVTRSFTVRKISSGVGVERTFPLMSPSLDRVEVISHGRVRRNRLYYLRTLKGKAARLQFELAGLSGLADENPEGAAPAELSDDAAAAAVTASSDATKDEAKETAKPQS